MPLKAKFATTSADDDAGLKTRLVKAARHLLEHDGFEALSLRAAAREAGVSHMAPYRHFKDKDELLAAVAEQGFRAMTRYMDRTAKGRGASRAVGVAYVSFALENPALYRLMFGANLAPRERFPGLVEAGAEAFQRCLAASAAKTPRIRAGEEMPRSAIALWSVVHGLTSLVIDGLVTLPPSGRAREAQIAAILREVR
ncbi:MAG: TetR/AcrR family transcriptional regulator [Methylovirgula sp.]|jgi:AcrR family transcriptional regulator